MKKTILVTMMALAFIITPQQQTILDRMDDLIYNKQFWVQAPETHARFDTAIKRLLREYMIISRLQSI